MFYDPREDLHPAPLAHNPFNALAAPRPIGWISSVSKQGHVNLAPFSYFNAISADPPMVMFAPNSKDTAKTPKDTFRNISEIPQFVVNLATYELREAVNLSSKSYPFDVNEMEETGLTAVPSENVRPPRVNECPATLECEVYRTVDLLCGRDGRQSHLVIGEVVGIHINDDVIKDGVVDQTALQQLARLGYFNYCWVDQVFQMRRPR